MTERPRRTVVLVERPHTLCPSRRRNAGGSTGAGRSRVGVLVGPVLTFAVASATRAGIREPYGNSGGCGDPPGREITLGPEDLGVMAGAVRPDVGVAFDLDDGPSRGPAT
jgi:hypothetical protein